MPCFNQYDGVIFDCDGVILDSNTMKISAMRSTLKKVNYPKEMIETAVDAFSKNFGKSRFFHSQYFVENLLGMKGFEGKKLQDKILFQYSQAVEDKYMEVPFTENFLPFIKKLTDKTLYVVSGSEEKQLIRIFKKRSIDCYFKQIYGSPKKKEEIVKKIVAKNPLRKMLFIGDAVSDYEAATKNKVDFWFYAPYSNVKEDMLKMSKTHNFQVFDSYLELYEE